MFPLNYYNSGVTLELNELIESGVDIWAFDYPSFYEGEQKTAFEKKVIDHYRFRQIGQETPGRWLHYFRTRMIEIMPYYIQLYKFQQHVDAIENPLESYNLLEEYRRKQTGSGTMNGQSSESGSVSGQTSGTTTGTSEAESSTESNVTSTGQTTTSQTGSSEKESTRDSTRRFSDTPQGEITNIDDYLTEATKENGADTEDTITTNEASENASQTVKDTNTTSTSGSNSETSSGTNSQTTESSGSTQQSTETTDDEEYTLSRRGNIGVQPLGTEVENIRHSFINIDMMVINELNDLFLQVY